MREPLVAPLQRSKGQLKAWAQPKDHLGIPVMVGTRVRIVGLSGRWLDGLPAEEQEDVLSMVVKVFAVEEIDEYGYPWVRKSWSDWGEGRCRSHSVALEPFEMEVVSGDAP